MARLNVVTPQQASGRVKELFDGIQASVGMIPQIYQGVANSAAALEGVLHLGKTLSTGQLSGTEIEAVKLVVSQAYGCNYCLAVHTLLGKKHGLTENETIAIRRGTAEAPRLGALVDFVNSVMRPEGSATDDTVRAVRAAGYNDAQVAEILLVVAQTVFTNLFNRVHQTPVDFPPAPGIA
ncbi:MAG: carboxymuconolactone decarboxylase family protein [Betaproteobacteria bacterium]|nr:carboxymuconolactone decarboxylase family protein [Betaproteobacteria bacterium]